jgi:hypothetical protein
MSHKLRDPKSRGLFWRIAAITVLVFVIAGAIVLHHIRQRLPAGFMKDVRAALAARKIPDADERFRRYLELRYGSLDDPANRKKAFLDFFNVEHVKSLQFLVKHTPENLRQANIDASAKWLVQYRESLTPAEREELEAELQSPDGRAMLRAATAEYNSQDVAYRGQTVPVISQLLTTIATLPKP